MVLYISVSIIAFVITFIVLNYIFDWWLSNWVVNSICVITVIALVFTLLCPILRSGNNERCAEAQRTYEELLLYKDVAEASDSEALRYNYYQKVSEWNADYYSAANKDADEVFLYWWGPYWCNVYYGTAPIDFELRNE